MKGKPADELEQKEYQKAFKIERYKSILQQLNSLNESTHKYISLFQTLATAVLGGGIAIFAAWKNFRLEPNIARLGLRAVLGLLTLLTFFVALSIIANVNTWYKLRHEERNLLSEEVSQDFRKPPSWKNAWRWNETYFVLFLLIILTAVWLFAEIWLIPNIVPPATA